jgi:hypothetical protein
MPGDDLAVLVVEAWKQADLVLEDSDVIVLAQRSCPRPKGRRVSWPTDKAQSLSVSIGRSWPKAAARQNAGVSKVIPGQIREPCGLGL